MTQIIGTEDIARMVDIIARIDPNEYRHPASKAIIYKCKDAIRYTDKGTFIVDAKVVLR